MLLRAANIPLLGCISRKFIDIHHGVLRQAGAQPFAEQQLYSKLRFSSGARQCLFLPPLEHVSGRPARSSPPCHRAGIAIIDASRAAPPNHASLRLGTHSRVFGSRSFGRILILFARRISNFYCSPGGWWRVGKVVAFDRGALSAKPDLVTARPCWRSEQVSGLS